VLDVAAPVTGTGIGDSAATTYTDDTALETGNTFEPVQANSTANGTFSNRTDGAGSEGDGFGDGLSGAEQVTNDGSDTEGTGGEGDGLT